METTKINVGPVRLSYPHLFTPQAVEGSISKNYSVCLLIPKNDTELINKLKQAMIASIPESAKNAGKLKPGYRLPLRDGDTEKQQDEFKGMFFMNCKSTLKPQVVKKVNGVFVACTEEEMYPGVWAYVNINFFAYDRNGNRGLSCSLNAVCKYKDDESFSGSSVNAEQLFQGVDLPDTSAASQAVSDLASAGGLDMPF